MKKYLLFAMIPTLLMFFCVLLKWNSEGLVFAISTIYRYIWSPILHFGIVGYLLCKKKIKMIPSIIASVIFVATVFFCMYLDVLINMPRNIEYNVIINLIWIIICGIFVLINYTVFNTKSGSSFFKVFIATEAVAALIINIFVPNLLADALAVKLAADGLVIVYLLATTTIVAAISLILGITVTEPHVCGKLIAWFIGIFVSVFGVFAYPFTLKSLSTMINGRFVNALILEIAITAILFGWSLVGVLVQNKFIQKARSELV